MTATSTYERIRTQAAELCEERHIRPIDDPDATRSLIADLVRQHQTDTGTTQPISSLLEMALDLAVCHLDGLGVSHRFAI